MRSINNSVDTPSIKLKINQKERIDEMKTTKTIKKSTIIDKKKIYWEFYAYILFTLVLEIIILVLNKTLNILNISRIIVFLLLLLLSLIFFKKIKEKVFLTLIIFIKIFQITTIFMNDEINILILLPLVYTELEMQIQQINKFKVFEKILIKFIGLGLVSIISKIPQAIAINIFLLFLEFSRAKIFCIKQKQQKLNLLEKQVIEEDQIINSKSPNQEVYIKEDAWKKRFYAIPLSILLISKQDLKITYKNQNLFKQFCDSFINEEELEDLIMNKLYFSFMSDHQEIIQLSSTNIIKLKQKKTNSLNYHNQKSCGTQLSSFDLMQKRTLSEILTSIQHGITGIERDYIELFCQQTEISGAKYQLEGKIILGGEDDEFFVIINDISKQNEIQSFIVKEEFKSKIIESFSHELRTPLNSAINFLEASISDPNVNDSLKLDSLEPAVNSLKLQAYLINDIIDFQNQSANQLELYVTEFSIQDFLSELTSLFSIQFHMKKITFNINLSKNTLLYFSTDQTRLTQIMVNLLQNALKYTSSGVIKIKMTSIQNDMMKIVLSDTGIGISPQVLQQIRFTLKNVEEYKDFQTFKTWRGFGLLIVALLHQSLCPPSQKSIEIESVGFHKGTKVKFYVMNFNYSSKQNTIKHSLSIKNTLKSMSGKRSYHTNSLSQIMPMNGTLFITQDLGQINQHMKKSEKYLNSPSNTLEDFSEVSKSAQAQYSTPDNNITNLYPYEPKLITNVKTTHQQINKKPLLQSLKTQKSQLVNLKQFRKLETLYREDIYKTIVTLQNKCNCKVILSVDDEIFNQKSVQKLLQQIGFEVKLAFSGDEAIQLVQSLNPCSQGCCLLTVILMDYQMPTKDGITTTRELKKLMNEGTIPEIPIVGLTAFTGQQEVRNCIIAGMSNVLSKPLKIQELKDVLASF